MAEVATPTAIDTKTGPSSTDNKAAATESGPGHKVKPEKPDEEKYKSDLAKAEKEHSAAQEKLNAIKAKLDLAKPANKDSPIGKKQQELRTELSSIRQQQSGFKTSRGSTQEQIAALDAKFKSRVAEQKTARARVPFKSVEELDSRIQGLDKQVDTGTMKLVDEKKALAEISALKKTRKSFAGFDEAQKEIDNVKGQIAELRKTMDNPEAKALSDRYSAITKELDDIKAEQDGAFKNLNSLRDERTKLQGEQQAKYTAMRQVKDNYFKGKAAYRDYEQEAWRQRQERQKNERDAFQKEKRKKIAAQKLEEASDPAYMDEIITSEGLIRYFDPNTPAEAKVLRGPSGFAAEAQRTVDESAIKGTKLSKKEDRDDTYFMGTGGKKGKKGKKGSATNEAPAEGKFNLPIGVIEELGKVGIEPPMNQGDVPAVMEKLKSKLEHWKSDQDKKTKENIAKAQAEIDRLEAEANESTPTSSGANRSTDKAKKPSAAHHGMNGDASAEAQLTQETDAADDAAEDLKKAKLEDETNA